MVSHWSLKKAQRSRKGKRKDKFYPSFLNKKMRNLRKKSILSSSQKSILAKKFSHSPSRKE